MLTVLVTREPKQKSPGRAGKEETKKGRNVVQLYGTGSSGGGRDAGGGSPLPKKHNQGATQHEEQPAERA